MKLKTRQPFLPTVVLILAAVNVGLAQEQKPKSFPAGSPAANSRTQAFDGGEELTYIAEFSRLLLKKMDVADFRFTVRRQEPFQKSSDSGLPSKASAPYALQLTGDISSKGFFSKLFNLSFRQSVESTVEPSSFSVQKTKRTDEQGKRVRVSETTYDRGKLFWIERDPNNPSRVPRTATVSFTGQVQDVLSAIYYLRTQPLEIGRSLELTLSDSGRVYQVPVKVVEKKRLKTVLGRVEALRVDPQLYGPNGMLGGKGQFSIWLTNDSRRIPVSARVKTDYGTFDITLRKVTKASARGYLTKKTT